MSLNAVSNPLRAVFETRRANLKLLADKHGGIGSLADKLGHSNGSFLSQLIGPTPTREVSEKVARRIELALSLRSGWLDLQA